MIYEPMLSLKVKDKDQRGIIQSIQRHAVNTPRQIFLKAAMLLWYFNSSVSHQEDKSGTKANHVSQCTSREGAPGRVSSHNKVTKVRRVLSR